MSRAAAKRPIGFYRESGEEDDDLEMLKKQKRREAIERERAARAVEEAAAARELEVNPRPIGSQWNNTDEYEYEALKDLGVEKDTQTHLIVKIAWKDTPDIKWEARDKERWVSADGVEVFEDAFVELVKNKLTNEPLFFTPDVREALVERGLLVGKRRGVRMTKELRQRKEEVMNRWAEEADAADAAAAAAAAAVAAECFVVVYLPLSCLGLSSS